MPAPGAAEQADRCRSLVRSLAAAGIRNPSVLAAMAAVGRHRFVAPEYRSLAWHDRALPIGRRQTISQPFVVARMAELALGDRPRLARVLEVGTGSGYHAAVLAELAERVYSVERIGALHRRAARNLAAAGIDNVELLSSDGGDGWPQFAPFDAVVVTAATREIREAWVDQLADPGRLVAPVGPEGEQQLVELRKESGRLSRQSLLPVRFVPLLAGVED